MIRVGLTGNVASGKSTVARAWAAAGVPVVDADQLAREAVAPGSEGLARVVSRFGTRVLLDDGTLDRGVLRAAILANPAERRALEKILHPEIERLRALWEAERAAEGHSLVVSEIPLLFEVGLDAQMDRVVVVHASEEERLRRLVDDRGLDPDEARRLMAAQGDPHEKRTRAHHLLLNEGSEAELKRAALELLTTLKEGG